MSAEILKVIQEMRERKVNHGRDTSPDLEAWADRLEAALPQQAEPTDTYTAVDMATAAAQGFRDGQAAVEQATAQDEQEIIGVERYRVEPTVGGFWSFCVRAGNGERELFIGHRKTCEQVAAELATAFEDGKFVATRPAQTEPAPAQTEREAKAWPALAGIGRDSGHPRAVVLYLRHEPSDEHLRMIQEALRTRPAQTEQQHPDDAAVDRFAAAMKAKLAAARAKGRGGWDDPNVCGVEFLAQLLVEHLGKGNAGTFEDVANFAMMLHQRGADPKVLADAAPIAQTSPQQAEPVVQANPLRYKDDPRTPVELSNAGCRCVRFGEGNPHWPCSIHTAPPQDEQEEDQHDNSTR